MNTQTILIYLVVLCILLPINSGVVDAAVKNPAAGKSYAKVWMLRGDVFAKGPSKKPRKLQNDSEVFIGEQISAAPDSEAVLKTYDAGIVAVRPGAEFIMERFAADGQPSDHQIVRLITGSLRIISGWISSINRDSHQIVTSSATIGVRGTDHEPYVLPPEMANNIYYQGTYDKVNRGSTFLSTDEGAVTIDNGKVGFALDPKAKLKRSRTLMTLLLPVLLTKVPEFYVPGAFEQELDRFAENADTQSLQELERKIGQRVIPNAPAISESSLAKAAPEASIKAPPLKINGCAPSAIAENWLAQLDQAMDRREHKTIIDLFAADIVVKATVRSGRGLSIIELDREAMVGNIINSLNNLKNYQQQRIGTEATLASGENEASCKKIIVKSLAIEQGLMNSKPYRFEAQEEYHLEQLNGIWQATKAFTTQR